MGEHKKENKFNIVPDFITRNAEAIKSMNNKNFQLLDYGCFIGPPIVSLITIHEKFKN